MQQNIDYRNVTVQRAFEISSNVGISKMITEHYGDRPEKFIKHLRGMALDKKISIEIKGEPLPFIKTPQHKDWSGVSIPFMSIGYEVQFTPLQMLALYNAIANDGKMVKPYLVSEVQEHGFGNTVERFEEVVIKNRICSKKTLEKVRILLEGAVEQGTAKNIKSKDYKIAGKTGTAQIADRKHGYQKIYQASFVGYFPADDPAYSCIVVINAPTSGVYYGSLVAAPVFKEIADKIYANSIEMHEQINKKDSAMTEDLPYSKVGYVSDALTIYKELGIAYKRIDQGNWVSSVKVDGKMELQEREIIVGLVPEVIGMGLRDALYLLGNMGLKVKVIGQGRVRKQSLRVGSRVKKGDVISIELS